MVTSARLVLLLMDECAFMMMLRARRRTNTRQLIPGLQPLYGLWLPGLSSGGPTRGNPWTPVWLGKECISALGRAVFVGLRRRAHYEGVLPPPPPSVLCGPLGRGLGADGVADIQISNIASSQELLRSVVHVPSSCAHCVLAVCSCVVAVQCLPGARSRSRFF
jgi:hypothetical protein